MICLTFEPSFFHKKKKGKRKKKHPLLGEGPKIQQYFLVIRLSDKWKRKKATHLDGIKVEGSTSIWVKLGIDRRAFFNSAAGES